MARLLSLVCLFATATSAFRVVSRTQSARAPLSRRTAEPFFLEAVDPTLISHMSLAAGVGALGDLVAQRGELAGRANASASEMPLIPSGVDLARTGTFATFGALYSGAFQHFWFEQLMSDETASAILANTPKLFSLAVDGGNDATSSIAASLIVATGRMAVNQGLAIPFAYYPLFFVLTAIVRSEEPEAALLRARSFWAKAVLANWRFWAPAQVIQFALVPTPLQVPYVLFVGTAWNVLLSSMDAKEQARLAAKEQKRSARPTSQ